MEPETSPVLIAIDNPALHPEAIHIAAATGRPVIDARDALTLKRHAANAHVVLYDAARAPDLADQPGAGARYFLADDPAAIDFEAALKSRADDAFVLPAQAGEVLSAIGQRTHVDRSEAGSGIVIAVVSSAGGAGCSTFAAALSRVAKEQDKPIIVDANRYSGGLDLLLGIEEEVGARWEEITIGEGDIQRDDVREALPATASGIAVLTSTRTKVTTPFILDQHELDKVVTPLSKSGLTIVDTSAHLVPSRCDYVVVLAPLEVRAAAAAARLIADCRTSSLPVLLVARHREWSGLTIKELERIVGTEVSAELPTIPRLTRAIEVAGLPNKLPRQLERAARRVYALVGAR